MTEDEREGAKRNNSRLLWVRTLVICFLIGVFALGMIYLINSTEPTAQRITASKKGPMLVDVIEVYRGDFSPTISAMGIVRPSEDLSLKPRVSGYVISKAESFDEGLFVQAGEWLLTLDPLDYENQLAQTSSLLESALANLALEKGQQSIARGEFELMGSLTNVEPKNASLILREPQLAAAQAKVDSASAAVKQAKLNLDRTKIRAPFSAQILSRSVSVGSEVSMGQEIARLVGIDKYWVTTSIPLEKLRAVHVASLNSGRGSEAIVRNRLAWQPGVARTGVVESVIGALDETSRMAKLNIGIKDPLSRKPANADKPPIIIGSLLQVSIKGKPIENVTRIPRQYLRNNNTVWLMQNKTLHVATVGIVFSDKEFVYINEGLGDGAKVITTGLSAIIEGAPLRTDKDS